MSAPAASAPPANPARAYLRVLLAGAVLGVPAAAGAIAFESLLHGATSLVWDKVPDWLGWTDPAWWYVILVPGLAGVLVALAIRLPGGGGHSALQGLSLEASSPIALTSILTAALITLAGGLVLGPEMPIMALGLVVGSVAARAMRTHEQLSSAVTLAGAFAAIATLFGGPLVAALFLFEMLAGSGKVPAQAIGRVLVPGFVAAGTGALLFTGVDGWAGVHEQALSMPGLPNYPTVRGIDVVWSVVVGAGASALIVGVRKLARALAPRIEAVQRPMLALAVTGLAVGTLGVVFRVITDKPVDLVLFSGESATGAMIAEGSAGVLLALILGKALGYALSLAGGFRGGPIFPAVTLGLAAGVFASQVLPGLDLTPAAIAGVAAGAAGAVRFPIFGALLASLLAGSAAAAETAPIAVIAAVVGWLVVLALEPEPQPTA